MSHGYQGRRTDFTLFNIDMDYFADDVFTSLSSRGEVNEAPLSSLPTEFPSQPRPTSSEADGIEHWLGSLELCQGATYTDLLACASTPESHNGSAFSVRRDACGDASKPVEARQRMNKRKRKQHLTLREHDEIEFVEDTTISRMGIPRRPLANVQNSLIHRRSTDALGDEFYKINLENERRDSIARKLNSTDEFVQFTEMEESDIQRRVSFFLSNLKPDTQYCVAPGDIPMEGVAATASPTKSVLDGLRDYSYTNDYAQRHFFRPASLQSVYVINELSYLLFKDNRFRAALPVGTHLLKPERKLVELVALAIDESPDGMLQVQQVYNYIMLKYPYFAFLDKLSTSSWRSSIRHALYQKWFRKIAVSDKKISSTGCFWAINKETTPREWSLPSQPKSPGKGLKHVPSSKQYTQVSSLVLPGSARNSFRDVPQCVREPFSEINFEEFQATARQIFPKSTAPSMWQPSVQHMFGRSARRQRPYHYGNVSARSGVCPPSGLRYPNRFFPPRRQSPLVPRCTAATNYMEAVPYAPPFGASGFVPAALSSTAVVSTVARGKPSLV